MRGRGHISRIDGKCPICGATPERRHIYCGECAAKVIANRQKPPKPPRVKKEPQRPDPKKQAQTGNDLPFEFECSFCGKVVEITERNDKRSRFCCAAHERQYWRTVTRHPTSLTVKHYWELFTDVNKYDK